MKLISVTETNDVVIRKTVTSTFPVLDGGFNWDGQIRWTKEHGFEFRDEGREGNHRAWEPMEFECWLSNHQDPNDVKNILTQMAKLVVVSKKKK